LDVINAGYQHERIILNHGDADQPAGM